MWWNRETLWMRADLFVFRGTATPFYLCAALTLDLHIPPHIPIVYQQSDPSKKFITKKIGE